MKDSKKKNLVMSTDPEEEEDTEEDWERNSSSFSENSHEIVDAIKRTARKGNFTDLRLLLGVANKKVTPRMINMAANETSTVRKMSMNNEHDFSYDMNETRHRLMDNTTVRFENPYSNQSSRHIFSDSGYKRRKMKKNSSPSIASSSGHQRMSQMITSQHQNGVNKKGGSNISRVKGGPSHNGSRRY